MRALLCCCLFALEAVAGPGGLTDSGSPSLTVVLDYEQPHSRPSFEAMRSELTTIMKRVGVSLDVKDKASLAPNTQFGSLVIFKMTGRCDATPVPIEALSDERGPLAMAYSSDGEILPFGEVRCDRIRKSLQRSIGRSLPSERDRFAYGTALGKVMAHEIYHMLAHDQHHTKTGLTKESLSSRELFEQNGSLPDEALDEIRRRLNLRN